MTTTFLHTADWQLGKAFGGISDLDNQAIVRRERIRVLVRLGELARENGCDFIVVAGDLFDSFVPKADTVVRAFEAIAAMEIPVVAIPGNHDHGGTGGPWKQDFILRQAKELAPNFTILLESEPYLELPEAVLLPCPLLTRQTVNDPTGWLREGASHWSDLPDKPRIVLAHGSVQGFGGMDSDDESHENRTANLIDVPSLPRDEFDYLALGDWHGTKKIDDKTWYSGAPETDRFPRGANYRSGQVLIVEASRGSEPKVQEVSSGSLNWVSESFSFVDDSGPEALRKRVNEVLAGRLDESLIRLELTGSLGLAAHARLQDVLQTWKAGLLRLKLIDRTTVMPTEEELTDLTRRTEDPLIGKVASLLIDSSKGEGEDASVARAALVLLFNFCNREGDA
jgi:DNA repair exonuclease SbcCD nuclease subunit